MDKPTRDEEDLWEGILKGYDLGMARGIARLRYAHITGVPLHGEPTKYEPDAHTPPGRDQNMTRINREQWADPVFKARRSTQVANEQRERWKDPEYRARLISSHTKQSMATCHPDRKHEALGLCSACYQCKRNKEQHTKQD